MPISFTFVAEKERVLFNIHSQTMTGFSQPFDYLIEAPIKEPQDKCAKLLDVNKEIFVGLVEFAHRGNYPM